jgi:hypothetical protein
MVLYMYEETNVYEYWERMGYSDYSEKQTVSAGWTSRYFKALAFRR